MDNPDKEFEAYLREFNLRQVKPFPDALTDRVMHPEASRPAVRWLLASAPVIVLGILSVSVLRLVGVKPIAIVEISGSYGAGEKLNAGSLVRAGGGESTVLVLEDGSRVEMRAESELSLERADDGLRLRLDEGSILVTAVKSEQAGRLRVENGDTIALAADGEFLFEATPSGKRIAVYGGEIEVQRALTLQKVVPGEQVWTGSSSDLQSPAEAIAWSRSAARLAGLLPPPPAPPTPPPVIEEPVLPPPTARIATATGTQEEPQPEPPQQPEPAPAPAPQPEQPQQPQTAADERGRQILNRECGSCHAVEAVNGQHFSNREAYANLVSKQIAFGAAVSAEEFPVLVDYLFKTYGLMK